MSFGARLIHPLVVVSTAPGVEDAYGHPTAGAVTSRAVKGLVQPRRAYEVELISQAGAPLSDHVVFLLPQDITGAQYIRDDPDTGRRFDIVGVRSFDFGRSPHLEVDCKLVGSPLGPTGDGS